MGKRKNSGNHKPKKDLGWARTLEITRLRIERATRKWQGEWFIAWLKKKLERIVAKRK